MTSHRAGCVAIVGRPNVGKSTLLNRLVGTRVSITSRKAQTTRHRITGILTGEGFQCAFVDTPGFQTRHGGTLNRALNRVVRESLADVDAALFVVEAGRFGDDDWQVLKLLPAHRPVMLVINKIDRLADKARLLPFIQQLSGQFGFAAVVPVSAARGAQIEALTAEVAARLPIGPPLFGRQDITDRSEPFLAAERVREAAFRLLGEELPYALAVAVDRFEVEGKLRRIHVTLLVEKSSQKAIVIGKEGERLKAIGSAARKEMETLFGGRVYLETWVKVKPGWAEDGGFVTRLLEGP